VFIRSLATRGSLGGLHTKIIELTDVMKIADFDYIIIETVGVGQSEVEIAGLADITIVVVVPEGGDEIQTIKAGVMEIADIFVVNKSDRPGADIFVKNLSLINSEIPIIKTIVTDKTGIKELMKSVEEKQQGDLSDKKVWLLTEKAWQLIEKRRMKGIDKTELKNLIEVDARKPDFNLYNFVTSHYND
jgi:LAO/AO transport system kinase